MSLEIKISKNKVSYAKAMNALNKRVESLKNSQGNELLWILEHPITFTGGIRAKDEEILDKSIKIVKTRMKNIHSEYNLVEYTLSPRMGTLV